MASLENSKKNGVTSPMLTDLYQITMVYGYWRSGKAADPATFDLYFRKNPFHGEFTIFAGLQECLRYIEQFEILDEGKQQCISRCEMVVEEFEFGLGNIVTLKLNCFKEVFVSYGVRKLSLSPVNVTPGRNLLE